MQKIFLETQRLNLLKPSINDSFLQTMFEDPEIMQFVWPGAFDKIQSKEAMAKIIDLWNETGFGPCILQKKDTLELIGCNGIKKVPIAGEDKPVIDLGFMLLKNFRGQGYIKESSLALIEFGIKQYGFGRFVARIFPNNVGAKYVLRSLNFKKIKLINSENDTHTHELWEKTVG